jgi:hypothetical protein
MQVLDPVGAYTDSDLPEDPPYFQACFTDVDRCQGELEPGGTKPLLDPSLSGTGVPNFGCKRGYTGLMCSECDYDFFYFQAKCEYACSDIEPRNVVTVFGILGVIVVWIVLNLVGCVYESFDVGVSYVQIISTVFTFKDAYGTQHSELYRTIVSISSLINLNPDIVSPSCMLPSRKWRYQDGYYILVFVPLGVFTLGLIIGQIAALWKRFVKKRFVFGVHLEIFCTKDRELQQYQWGWMKATVLDLPLTLSRCDDSRRRMSPPECASVSDASQHLSTQC